MFSIECSACFQVSGRGLCRQTLSGAPMLETEPPLLSPPKQSPGYVTAATSRAELRVKILSMKRRLYCVECHVSSFIAGY